MRYLNIKRLNRRAFTLIEIISVIIILALLVLVMIPSIREFVSEGRQATYNSYVKNMKNAAVGYMTECIRDNDLSCELPKMGESSVIYLSDLIKMGFSDQLRDPEAEGYCDENASYVTIINKGNNSDDVDYEACLYCSNYQTSSPTCVRYTGEGSTPVCGTVTGSSTTWTNKNRTVSVACIRGGSDPESECSKEEFSKTFIASTDKGVIRINTDSGKSADCTVDVKVDKDVPTCKLNVKSGNLSANGWYGGNVVVELNEQNDTGGSGILTYGIGTSLNTRNYNRNSEINIGNGVTTVFGYVMDKAGNEGYCSLEIKADLTKPVISKALYGYQIYPDKESKVLSGLNVNGSNYTTTNNDPQINITGLTNYKELSRVIVWFTNPITTSMNAQLFYKTLGNSYSEANSVKRIVTASSNSVSFEIPKGTYDGIRVDLGDKSGLTYGISRIDVIAENNSTLYTNKDVRLLVEGSDTVTGIGKFSYDDGLTWVTQSNKLYSTNQNIIVKVMDSAGNVSESLVTKVDNIDKLSPSCAITSSGTINNGWYNSNVTVAFGNTVDAEQTAQNVMSGVKRYAIGSINSGNMSVSHTTDTNSNGVTYTGYIEDEAGNIATCTGNVKKDSTAPTVTFNPNGNGSAKKIQSTIVTQSDGTGSGVSSSQYAWSMSNTIQPTFSTNYTSGQTISNSVSVSGNYYLWIKVIDVAGNTRVTVSNAFNTVAPTYTVAYNSNGGVGNIDSTTCVYNSNCSLTTSTPTRTNYDFLGWSTSSSDTTTTYTSGQSVRNLTAEDTTITLFAVWREIPQYRVDCNITGGTCNYVSVYRNGTALLYAKPLPSNYTITGATVTGTGCVKTSQDNSTVGITVTNVTSNVTCNVTLTTQPPIYTITYDAGTGTGAPASDQYSGDSSTTISSTTPTKSNYLFKCWATSTPSSTCAYNPGDTIQGGSITLYAVYAVKTFVEHDGEQSHVWCQDGAENKYDFYNNLNTLDPNTGVWRLTGHIEKTVGDAKGETYYRCFKQVANQYGVDYGCNKSSDGSYDNCKCPGLVVGYSTSNKSSPPDCKVVSGGFRVRVSFKYAVPTPGNTYAN